MKGLAEFLIALTDLAEAEGRALRRSVGRVGLGLGLAALATVLAAVGLALSLFCLYRYVAEHGGDVMAAGLTGLAALLAAGGLAWLVHRVLR